MSDNRNTLTFRVEISKTYPGDDPESASVYKVSDDSQSPGVTMCSLVTCQGEYLKGFLNGRYGIRYVDAFNIPDPPASLNYEITLSPWCGARLARRLSDDPALAPAQVEPVNPDQETGMPIVLRFIKRVGKTRLGDWQRALDVKYICRVSAVEMLLDALEYGIDFAGWTWVWRDGVDVLVDAAGQDRFTVAR